MSRRKLSVLGLVLVLFTAIAPAAAQSAPAPTSWGTLRTLDSNAAWGTWQSFPTSSNTFGFWMRFQRHNGNVLTVVPFEKRHDGQVTCWFIEYSVVGASDPNRAQWHEVAGGRVVLNPATWTLTSLDGAIAQSYVMVGYSRQSHQHLQFDRIRLTIP